MRGKAHSDEIRAQVMAALLAGQGVTETAKQYKIPHQTVSRIKNEILPEQLGEIGREKARRIESMLFGYLCANLEALQRQCKVASDETYLKRQPASELATLHGVMADKSIRLLEAALPAEQPEEAADAE